MQCHLLQYIMLYMHGKNFQKLMRKKMLLCRTFSGQLPSLRHYIRNLLKKFGDLPLLIETIIQSPIWCKNS